MTFIDTNVILDVFDNDPVWFGWSSSHLAEVAIMGAALINSIVVAELSRNFDDLLELHDRVALLDVEVGTLGTASAFLAGKRFQAYRRTRDALEPRRGLPDFFIGAHALTLGVPLLTRDARLYRRYFPDLLLITPETNP